MTETANDRDDDPNGGDATRWRAVVQRRYDRDQDDELAAAIVFAIAGADGVPASDVEAPSLYEVINVGALEQALFGRESRDGSERLPRVVTFRYRNYLITVRDDGWVQVYEPDEPELQ